MSFSPHCGAVLVIVLLFLATAGCLDTVSKTPADSPALTPQSAANPHPPHYHPLHTFSLYMMQKNAPPGLAFSLPTFLPEGFFFTSGSVPQGPVEKPFGNGEFLFTYSRGQDEEVLLVEQFRNSTKCSDQPVFQPAVAGSLRAARKETGELTWGDSGWCYMLTGTLPQEDLEKIGASVRPVMYREGVTPPYEYVPPARPLVGKIPVNMSLSTGREMVTIDSIKCTPEACTVMIRISDNTPPPVTPSPVVTFPSADPDLHAVWQVDGGRPLMTMPGGGYSYNTTSVSWKIEPLSEGSRELTVNFSSVRGISGPWQFSIPLQNLSGTGQNFGSSLPIR
ncbi:MAG: hypothetical protein WC586_09290 [Methanoregula sp.]